MIRDYEAPGTAAKCHHSSFLVSPKKSQIIFRKPSENKRPLKMESWTWNVDSFSDNHYIGHKKFDLRNLYIFRRKMLNR